MNVKKISYQEVEAYVVDINHDFKISMKLFGSFCKVLSSGQVLAVYTCMYDVCIPKSLFTLSSSTTVL